LPSRWRGRKCARAGGVMGRGPCRVQRQPPRGADMPTRQYRVRYTLRTPAYERLPPPPALADTSPSAAEAGFAARVVQQKADMSPRERLQMPPEVNVSCQTAPAQKVRAAAQNRCRQSRRAGRVALPTPAAAPLCRRHPAAITALNARVQHASRPRGAMDMMEIASAV